MKKMKQFCALPTLFGQKYTFTQDVGKGIKRGVAEDNKMKKKNQENSRNY